MRENIEGRRKGNRRKGRRKEFQTENGDVEEDGEEWIRRAKVRDASENTGENMKIGKGKCFKREMEKEEINENEMVSRKKKGEGKKIN